MPPFFMTTSVPQIAFGLEIETPWATMLARVDEQAANLLAEVGNFYKLTPSAQDRVQKGFDALDAEYADRLSEVFNNPDVRRGKDSFAEFALQPKPDTEALVETVEGLYDVGLLVAHERYPLQVTIGNMPAGVDAAHVLMAAEICGGSSSQRILEVNTWSRRGVAGLHPRKPSELQLGMRIGVELRSLQLSDMTTLRTSLNIIELGSRAVVESKAGDRDASDCLRDLRAALRIHAADYDIDTTIQWWNPQGDPYPWQAYGQALASAEWVATTQASIESVLR